MTFQKKNYIDYLPNCYLGHLPVWHRYYIRYEKSPKLTISIEKAPICNGSCRRCNNNHKFIITNQSTHPKHHNVSLTCNKKKTIISTQQISNRTWKNHSVHFFGLVHSALTADDYAVFPQGYVHGMSKQLSCLRNTQDQGCVSSSMLALISPRRLRSG